MDNWFYGINGAQQGPVTQAALSRLLASGQLPSGNLVWREGMADWIPAHLVPELAGDINASPPTLGYGISDSAYRSAGVEMKYAGFWIRFAGAFIDGIATSIAGKIFGAMEGGMVGTVAGHTQKSMLISMSIGSVTGIIIGWLYFAFFISSAKQASPGMMAVGLRVTDLNGNRISFARATGRHFASILSSLILGIGYLMMLWSPRKQTLHDQLAGTLVLTK